MRPRLSSSYAGWYDKTFCLSCFSVFTAPQKCLEALKRLGSVACWTLWGPQLVLVPFTGTKLGDLRGIRTKVDEQVLPSGIFKLEYPVDGVFELHLPSLYAL